MRARMLAYESCFFFGVADNYKTLHKCWDEKIYFFLSFFNAFCEHTQSHLDCHAELTIFYFSFRCRSLIFIVDENKFHIWNGNLHMVTLWKILLAF